MHDANRGGPAFALLDRGVVTELAMTRGRNAFPYRGLLEQARSRGTMLMYESGGSSAMEASLRALDGWKQVSLPITCAVDPQTMALIKSTTYALSQRPGVFQAVRDYNAAIGGEPRERQELVEYALTVIYKSLRLDAALVPWIARIPLLEACHALWDPAPAVRLDWGDPLVVFDYRPLRSSGFPRPPPGGAAAGDEMLLSEQSASEPKRHTILFVAANPSGSEPIALDQEARSIHKELEASGFRDHFELETRWALEPLDLLSELRKLKPTVVHFAGHGGKDGLFLQASDGSARAISPMVLSETFAAAGASVKLVVLNACYSEPHAEALISHVDCVVGISGAIPRDAARSFAIGFYGGLGERESVATAYKQGLAAIGLARLNHRGRAPGSERDVAESVNRDGNPQLKVRAGIDASHFIVAADPP